MAITAGLIIFPACFSYGVEVTSGPSLIFITLPNVFVNMTGGRVWGALFFHEAVTPGKLLGAALVIAGVILFERADGEAAESEADHG